ncbi:hypothetical protein [Lacticaseibacillus sp. N501-2]|uniref:hypothetical protein n=1 Tax=Lacticaseibacillus salsurae TaxID=3367729 RepID=UPI0038B2D781
MDDSTTVRSSLKSIIEVVNGQDFKVNGRPASTQDVLDLVAEDAYAIADLLGMSDLYLGGEGA